MVDEGAVHVIDDDIAVRQSLAFLLATAGLTVRLYDSAVSFLSSLDDGAISGCVVTDIRMPEVDGLELLRRVRQRNLPLRIIVITGHADIPLAVQAMKEGAVDFIEKPFDDDRLLASIRSSLASAPTVFSAPNADLEMLSERERQVLDGIMAGKQNKVIAYDLGLSPRTVEVYRANVMVKMKVDSLPELVRKVLAGKAG